jgi:hypothetical protein
VQTVPKDPARRLLDRDDVGVHLAQDSRDRVPVEREVLDVVGEEAEQRILSPERG